jgi:4-nitrophenyl phosphatase
MMDCCEEEEHQLTSLSEIQNLVIDMDGVLYRGDEPMPGLQEFFAFLRARRIQFVLATNNSTRTPRQYTEKMARMGVDIAPEEVLHSGQATARVIARQYGHGARVYVFGMPSLREAMLEEGLVVADEDVQVVVGSMDREVTYDKVKRATLLIRGGASFYATNLDPTVPSPEGLLPGTGCMVAMLEVASGVTPIAIGKPEPTMFEVAMARMSADRGVTATIGDRVDTDLLGGRRAGLTTICVLSGSSNRAQAESFGPDYIFDDIADLLSTWERL